EGEAGCFGDFTGSPTENWGNWKEILHYQGSTWQSTTHALPAGQESVWVAFWLDDGAGDHGMIDNIHVTTTVVPEPISSTLFLVGAATLGYRRFRKKR
ncbi:MAG: PEP-CTERM sorting domain-containing protein, partial [Nitrospiraceae bacterium]